jgi:hypothetical protein
MNEGEKLVASGEDSESNLQDFATGHWIRR